MSISSGPQEAPIASTSNELTSLKSIAASLASQGSTRHFMLFRVGEDCSAVSVPTLSEDKNTNTWPPVSFAPGKDGTIEAFNNTLHTAKQIFHGIRGGMCVDSRLTRKEDSSRAVPHTSNYEISVTAPEYKSVYDRGHTMRDATSRFRERGGLGGIKVANSFVFIADDGSIVRGMRLEVSAEEDVKRIYEDESPKVSPSFFHKVGSKVDDPEDKYEWKEAKNLGGEVVNGKVIGGTWHPLVGPAPTSSARDGGNVMVPGREVEA